MTTDQENFSEGYMTELESAQAMMEVIAEISKLIAPMGGHIGREIRIMASSHTPAVTISIGFRADVLKRYSAQFSVPDRCTAHTLDDD